MTLCWLVLALVLALPRLVLAQCSGITVTTIPFASEVLTIDGTARVLTPAKYQPSGSAANMAKITIESGDIRYYEVGTPTPTDGHYVASVPPQSFFICGLDAIKAFKAIRVSSDAKATVTYYKPKSP